MSFKKIKLKSNRCKFFAFILIFFIFISSPSSFFLSQNPRISGTTPPSFSNFSPTMTTNKTPDVSIQVNDSESGLNVDSGQFAYTNNGSEPYLYSNPYRDDFNDDKIGGYWSFRNQANGSFIESGSNITISDLNGDHTWSGNTRNAPFMYQTIMGDVIAQVKVSATLIEGWDIAGLLVCDQDDNFFLYQYTLVPFGAGIYNIALWSSISGVSTRIGVFTLGLVDDLWMRIIRSGDEFAGFYSVDGINYELLGFSDILLTKLTQVGMFVGDNTNATFDDWTITPWIECTGQNGTNNLETMSVHEIPFNHYSDDENKINFKISDMNGNTAISDTFTIETTEIPSPASFESFSPSKSNEKNPSVQISVQDASYGINKYSAAYAYSTSGKDPIAYMNPYSDSFDDENIQDCWEKINPENGVYEESLDGLNFSSIGNYMWNATNHDAPCLTENFAGTFSASVKISPIDLQEGKSAGIIAILSDTYAFKLLLENESGLEKVSFYFINETDTTLLGNLTPTQVDPIWLKLSREKDEWTAQYSIDGDTYAVYFDIAAFTFTSWIGALNQPEYYAIPRISAKVGLIVENGASALYENWNPTPTIEISGNDGSTSEELITVNIVYFEQFSETNNKITFSINSTNNAKSYSQIYTVNSTALYEFRDNTLLADGSTLKIINDKGETIWSWSSINAADLEMLPNGNILAVDYGGMQSANAAIKEINITSSSVVWTLSNVGGRPLNFTHDVDYLGYDENGHETYLIADSSNNRVVECYKNGTIKWEWNALDHYTYGYSAEGDPLLEGGWDWTHINDADRLPDGSTMISLRNFDKVIIVNTTEGGELLWEYGEYGNYSLCRHQHNPEYTPRETVLIADSENHRIIEINMTTKDIIWEYAPTGDEYLAWPRDADILPNGNMLISDTAQMGSGHNRIWEIDTETKEVVWYYDTVGANYDADRLDTILPLINFKSPINTTYTDSIAITISLQNEDPWYDEMYYRIYDLTDGKWLTDENVTYFGSTQVYLSNLHSYSLHAWAKDVVMEGGAYPTDRAIIQWGYNSVDFTVNLSTEYSPSKPFPGNTLISPDLKEVSPEGEVLWSYHQDGKITWDAQRLANGNYLFSITDKVQVNPYAPLVNNIIEMTPNYEVVWNYTILGPMTHNHETHDIDKLPNGNYLIANMNNDSVIEVNSTYDIVWEWRSIDHLPLPDPIPDDWVHLNDVDRLPNGNTLMTLRNYDSVIEVNPNGDIVWQYGDLVYVAPLAPKSNHTKLWGPHNADRLTNGNTMIADSLNHRCIQVDPTGKIVWEVNQSQVDLLWPRDCDLLPNGNVLIADSWHYRIIEINSTFDIVWQCSTSDWAYDADRIDITPPTINVNSIKQADIVSNNVVIDITSPDLDTDTIWYNIWDENSNEWVDLTMQGGTNNYQVYNGNPDTWYLDDGNYTLWVWANDTGYPMVGSDQQINIREIQVNFEVGYGLKILTPDLDSYFSTKPFDFEIRYSIEGILDKTWYRFDNEITKHFFTGINGTIDQTSWDKLAEGKRIIYFYANNSMGVEILNQISFYKDTLPPSTIISYVPFKGTNSVIKSTLFTLSAEDGIGIGVSIIRYRIDNSLWADYYTPFNLTNLTYGTHTIFYFSIDNLNNVELTEYTIINLVDELSYNDPTLIITIIIFGSVGAVVAVTAVAYIILRRRGTLQRNLDSAET